MLDTQPESVSRGVTARWLATPSVLRWMAIAASGLVVTAVMAAPSSPISNAFIDPSINDYGEHVTLAEELTTNGPTFPHFLWHALVVVVHSVGPWLSWVQAARIVVVASYGLQGAALAWIVTTMVAAPRKGRQALGLVILALLLVTVAPVTVLTWNQPALYYGYLNMESYASPTHAVLKPLALIVFAFAARAFTGGGGLRDGVAFAVAVALSALAKPSLLICLVPAAFVLAGLRCFSHREVHLRYLIAGLVVPSVAMLTWQYLLYLGPWVADSDGGRNTVIFAPFLVMGYFAKGLGPKFLMSILLPLTVVLAYRRQVVGNSTMQLAWLQFAFGAAFTYLLAESRETMAGNFAWSGQIGTYLLFVSSTIFALRHWTAQWRSVVCAVAFGLHAASGVLYFAFPLYSGPVPPP